MVINLGQWPNQCDHKCKRPKLDYYKELKGVNMLNKVRSSEIRKFLKIEPLLFQVERSQLKWFGHVLLARANGRRPVGRPRTRWTNYIEYLGWIGWDFTQTKRWMWWKTVKCGSVISSCFPRNSQRKNRKWTKKKKKKESQKFRTSYFVTNATLSIVWKKSSSTLALAIVL